MSILDTIDKLIECSISRANLKYCLVDSNKRPFKTDNTPARPNCLSDFVDLENLLQCENLDSYAGVGISIQASNICAIDIDKCFSIKNDISSADDRAIYFLSLFKDKAYCEFSFSGTGLRILFTNKTIENYSDLYYIKNSKYHIEFYQPSNSYRYVTVTGNCIHDNAIVGIDCSKELEDILNKYMKKTFVKRQINVVNDSKSYEELMKDVRKHLFSNHSFQDAWFKEAPGSGKNESERDFQLISYLYENITQDKNMLKSLFESSNFFKTKDSKHIYKWTAQNGRYFEYLYNLMEDNHK